MIIESRKLNHERTTCGFVQVRRDVVISAMCKHQQQFQLDE